MKPLIALALLHDGDWRLPEGGLSAGRLDDIHLPVVPTGGQIPQRNAQAHGDRSRGTVDPDDEARIDRLAVDTNRPFETVNGVKANGGTMDGPVVAGGMLYVNSGYGGFVGRPGNVLLAFGVD